jgi:cytochrome c oxidase accessory protein FixG
MPEPVSKHLIGFIAILIFSFVFYFVFAHAREIVCTVVCPYGRLQSVLLDKNSIVVAYDYLRGEPRAKASKGREPGAGDCIDCDLCVQVCPTGIDIRNGTQMECTNCTACIDACNMMMKKTSRPPDLIKYASENNIKEGATNRFTYRIKMYTAALIVLIGLFTYLLGTRKTLDVTVMRVSGQILQENKDGTISNLYRMKIINKSGLSQPFKLIPSDPELKLHFVGKQEDSIPGKSQNEYMFFINKSTEDIKTRKELFKLKIMSGQKVMHNVKLPFIGEN